MVVLSLSGTAFAGPGSCGAQTASSCGGDKHDTKLTLVSHENGAEKDIVDTAVAAGKFNTLAAALKAAGLVDTLKGKGPFTVFAPTDEAFAKLGTATLESLLKPENKAKLTSILTYHVVAGEVKAADVVKLSNATTVNGQRVDIKAKDGKVSVDGANVIATDVAATNGVIHVIDTVILPSDKNVVETAVAAGKFNTLAKLLVATGLDKALAGEGPFTVFAPTDDAFAKLPKETLESLAKPENKEKLAGILKYHVIAGSRIFSDAAVKAGTAKTLQGESVKIKADGKNVKIDGATVTGADIDTANGVIHVIDSVILPK
ncbi:MAG: fasciclin domain-containing protein [Planctomycetota bacterium]|nr:fasciclin domain-containing protein [Planctomycetota bacterium]